MVDRTVQSDKYPDGKLRIERQVAKYSDNHFVADGFYREYYPNGQKFVDGQYKAGRPDGEWTYWHENGTVNRKSDLQGRPARRHLGSPSRRWFSRRHAQLQARQARRRLDNLRRYRQAAPSRRKLCRSAKPTASGKSGSPPANSNVKSASSRAIATALAIEWDEKGNKRIEMNYAAGKLDGTATTWTPDGRKITQEFKDGKPVADSSSK